MLKLNKSLAKKGMTACAALLTAALVVTGCGGSGGGSKAAKGDVSLENRYALDANTPAWKLDKKEEPTQLTWYVNADWWNTDFGNDVVTKKIKEDLNIDIKFVTGDDTKLNTFLRAATCRT
ncbi:hypothetical protein HMSSN139_32040 [Paenibacillus sp. HMSSN-139]|nr:hypothetical protein HMSSN139_32040 [Paenibacillus sp. HMSSN-139]